MANELSKLIKKERELKSLSKAELSVMAKVSYNALDGIEKGISIPMRKTLFKITKELGIDESIVTPIYDRLKAGVKTTTTPSTNHIEEKNNDVENKTNDTSTSSCDVESWFDRTMSITKSTYDFYNELNEWYKDRTEHGTNHTNDPLSELHYETFNLYKELRAIKDILSK